MIALSICVRSASLIHQLYFMERRLICHTSFCPRNGPEVVFGQLCSDLAFSYFSVIAGCGYYEQLRLHPESLLSIAPRLLYAVIIRTRTH